MTHKTVLSGLAVFALLTGCQNLNRPMVFTTATAGSVEISTYDQTGKPGNIVIDYRRAEVLFAPIMEKNKNGDPTDYAITDEAHSVIAKLAGKIKAEGEYEADTAVAQWFASGKAAELLAENGATDTLTDNKDVAKSVIDAKRGGRLNDQGGMPLYVVHTLKNLAANLAKPKSGTKANELADKLNQCKAVTQNMPLKTPYTKYKLAKKDLDRSTVADINGNRLGKSLGGLLNYYGDLEKNVKVLDDVLINQTASTLNGKPISKKVRKRIKRELRKYESILAKLEKDITEDPDIIAVMNVLAGN